jgi:hypothetical protein
MLWMLLAACRGGNASLLTTNHCSQIASSSGCLRELHGCPALLSYQAVLVIWSDLVSYPWLQWKLRVVLLQPECASGCMQALG